MAIEGWWSLFTAAISGGAAMKLADILYGEWREWRIERKGDSKSVEANLGPLLKAADELVGKLRSLAEQDFLPIHDIDSTELDDVGFSSVVYLFVQFWANVELIREKNLDGSLGRSAKGKQLQSFLTCLESRRVRLMDRISQRAAGEAALLEGRPLNFVEFIRNYDDDPYMRRWLKPLIQTLSKMDNPGERQHVLQYAVVLHALIDTLDQAHIITHERPATPNKLTKKSWKALNYRVFGVYLTFVSNTAKYIGPPKGRP
ncbi:MAG: hypothetical protein KDE07_10305 [Sphingomonadaceae bacterium]|nr:hypothetical protein [Sphingomonadaceae bacterium]